MKDGGEHEPPCPDQVSTKSGADYDIKVTVNLSHNYYKSISKGVDNGGLGVL